MFHRWRLNNRIKNVHERALLIIYPDYEISFTGRSIKSLTIHNRNLLKLVNEMFKVKVVIATEIINDIFQIEGKPSNFPHNFW